MNRKNLDDFLDEDEDDEWESLLHHRNRPQSSEKTKRSKVKIQSENMDSSRRKGRKKPDRPDY